MTKRKGAYEHPEQSVRIECESCGPVVIPISWVTMRHCLDTDDETHLFKCPGCHVIRVKDTHPVIGDLLRRYGVKVTRWRLPLELAEPHRGPRLTHDDLLAFHAAMQGDDWAKDLA